MEDWSPAEKIERRDVLERRVFIEPGSQMATFAIVERSQRPPLPGSIAGGSHITLGWE